MRKLLMAISTAALLASCTNTDGTLATTPEDIARATAKTVIKPIVAAKFPGVPTDMAVDCVVDNASMTEIFQIAESAVTGTPADSSALVLTIATRPATVLCIAEGATGGTLGLGALAGLVS